MFGVDDSIIRRKYKESYMIKNPYFSIIIPAYNSGETLKLLLDSLNDSNYRNFEVIVVDDGSTDKTLSVLSKFKVIKQRHQGAGAARNTGAKIARGEILVFVDSDVVLFKDTLSELVKSFKKPKTQAIIGVYDKKPTNPSFFTHFKALRDFSYIMFERDPRYPIGGFGGWLSAIRKTVFQDLGGFNESYRGAGMEDYEFAWRLVKSTKIIFNPKVRIKHHFPDFLSTVKNFYQRSYLWTQLYMKHRKFFSSATNPREAIIAGLANLSTALFFLSLFFAFLWPLFLVVFLSRLYLGKKFLVFALEEKGFLFALISLLFSHTLYLAVYAGAARAFVLKILGRYRAKRIAKSIVAYIKSNDRVLDVGSGNGLVAEELLKLKKVSLIAVDVTSRYNLSAIEIKLYDGKRLPFKDKAFDLVLLLFVLHHAKNPRLVLKEAARVTKNLVLLFEDIAWEEKWKAELAKKWHRLMDWVSQSEGEYRPFRRRKINAFAKESGLAIIKEEEGYNPSFAIKQTLMILQRQ